MSCVVGIDVSSFAVDLMKLDENVDHAEWTRIMLPGGALAWERLQRLPEAMPASGYWENVYLVAIEAPHGRGEAGTQAKLNQVVGAVAATLPRELRKPERLWLVRPDEWKTGLGLKGKPTGEDITRLTPSHIITAATPEHTPDPRAAEWQNGMDAYCLALWARDTNAKGVAAA